MDDRPSDLPARELLAQLASSAPVPGGGSASALAGAMGAALIHMVVSLSTGRPGATQHEASLTEIGLAAAALQSELTTLADLDAVAYDAVVRARRLPKASLREQQLRATQLAGAVREATRVPLDTVHRASEVLGLAERLSPIGNGNAISDVGVGGLLAGAAMRGAALNVRINLPSLAADDPLATEAPSALEALLVDIDAREAAMREAVEARIG